MGKKHPAPRPEIIAGRYVDPYHDPQIDFWWADEYLSEVDEIDLNDHFRDDPEDGGNE